MIRKHYSPEFKQQTVQLALSGEKNKALYPEHLAPVNNE